MNKANNIISLGPFVSALMLNRIESIVFIVLGTVSFILSITISIKTVIRNKRKNKTLTLKDIEAEIKRLEVEARKLYEKTK